MRKDEKWITSNHAGKSNPRTVTISSRLLPYIFHLHLILFIPHLLNKFLGGAHLIMNSFAASLGLCKFLIVLNLKIVCNNDADNEIKNAAYVFLS